MVVWSHCNYQDTEKIIENDTLNFLYYTVSSIAQSCLTFCDFMDCSTPGLPESTNSWSLLKLMSIESVMPSNHLTLCWPLLPLLSNLPKIRVFSNDSALHIRWPKYYCSFSLSISPSNESSGLISFRTGLISLQSKGLSIEFSTTPQF